MRKKDPREADPREAEGLAFLAKLIDVLREHGATRYVAPNGMVLEVGALAKPSKELTREEREKLAEVARDRELDVEWAHVPGGAPPWVRTPLTLNRQVPGDDEDDPS